MHESDSHDTNFDDMMQMTTFSEYEEIVNFAAPRNKNQTELEYCRYRYIVYATEELKDEFTTSKPIVYALITAGIFLFTSIVFVFYDVMVNVRQAKVMASAKRTNAIVSTLFPQNVRDRLFAENSEGKKTGLGSLLPSKLKMQSFLDDEAQDSLLTSEPIADLFPHAVSKSLPLCFMKPQTKHTLIVLTFLFEFSQTIMFLDIA